MSKYTTELRYICEMNSGFPVEEMSAHSTDEIISASREKIFDFSYPIYDESHKPELETKILKHYYTREIGAETVGLWKLWLNEKLNLIMPKYNKLYEFEALSPGKDFYNVDIETYTHRDDDFTTDKDATRTDNLLHSSDHTRTDNLTDTNSNTRTDNLTKTDQGTGGTTDKFSDTPQGTVSNVDNGTYLTEYRKIDETHNVSMRDTGTVTDNGSLTHTGTQRTAGTDTDTGTQRTAGTDKNYGEQEINGWERGYRGTKTYTELIMELSDKIINIDKMIIDDLRDLFILLW